MFDKLRSKSNGISSRRNPSYSNIGRSAVDVPAIITPRQSTDGDHLSSYQSHSRSSSTGDVLKQRSQSTPGDVSRERSKSLSTSRPGSLADPTPGKKRHVFWRSSLWHSKKHNNPIRSSVRASSQSIALPHPSVAEEQMRNMPHHDWQGRNKPDQIYDDENLARLYW